MTTTTPSDEEALRWVRLTFVDVFGTSNSVQLPARHFDAAVAHGATFDGSAMGLSPASSCTRAVRGSPGQGTPSGVQTVQAT